jgi:uncharacterized metal-binding protein
MANGKAHDRFNMLIGAAIGSALAANGEHPLIIATFAFGWLIATFIFSPDTDLMPKKRAGWLRYFLYPYSIFFKHRGVSHSLLFGTFTRVFYIFLLSGLMIFIFFKMGYLSMSGGDYFLAARKYFQGYDYKVYHYRLLTWLYLGMFLADASHIFLDKLSSLFKRVFP